MVGRTNVGGGSPLYAVIAVTYPEGSVCTCGGKAAKDTSGYALFNVKAGTYTVECHTSDNSQSKSTSVTVEESDSGKSFPVTLTYELTIFAAGTGFSAGLTVTNNVTGMIVVTDDNITIKALAGYGYMTVDQVDVSSYSTIFVDAEVVKETTYKMPVDFGIGLSRDNCEAIRSIPNNTERNIFSLDISEFSGEKTLFLGSNSGGGTVYNWWLE